MPTPITRSSRNPPIGEPGREGGSAGDAAVAFWRGVEIGGGVDIADPEENSSEKKTGAG